eukprot:SAG11_NODE_5514_length_1539_cov_1.110417_2_plen_137_part_00
MPTSKRGSMCCLRYSPPSSRCPCGIAIPSSAVLHDPDTILSAPLSNVIESKATQADIRLAGVHRQYALSACHCMFPPNVFLEESSAGLNKACTKHSSTSDFNFDGQRDRLMQKLRRGWSLQLSSYLVMEELDVRSH